MDVNTRMARELVKVARMLVAGHSCYEREFPDGTTKEEIRRDIDRAMLNQYDPLETSQGMASNLVTYNAVFDSREKALDFLEPMASRYQDCACRFRTSDLGDMYERYYPLYKRIFKAAFDRVAEWLDTEDVRCPVCGKSSKDRPIYMRGHLMETGYDKDRAAWLFRANQLYCHDYRCVTKGGPLYDFADDPEIKRLAAEKKSLDAKWEAEKRKVGKPCVKWIARADRHV